MYNYLVHIVNSVTNWTVSQVHVIAGNEAEAVSKALQSLNMTAPDPNDPVKVIPQLLLLGEVVHAVETPPVVPTPVLSEAEQAAEHILESLPEDILTALKGRL